MPLPPASEHKRATADDLKRNAAQEHEFDQGEAIKRPRCLHKRYMFVRPGQPDQMIGDMQADKGCDKGGRECMQFAKCHVTANHS